MPASRTPAVAFEPSTATRIFWYCELSAILKTPLLQWEVVSVMKSTAGCESSVMLLLYPYYTVFRRFFSAYSYLLFENACR